MKEQTTIIEPCFGVACPRRGSCMHYQAVGNTVSEWTWPACGCRDSFPMFMAVEAHADEHPLRVEAPAQQVGVQA